jgi:DTW domain-containing protein YfiP
MKPALCLCGELVRRRIGTSVRVVIHEIELQKSTNSGRLLPLLIDDAALVPYGARDTRLDPLKVAPPGSRPVVLFPVEGARTIDAFVYDDDNGSGDVSDDVSAGDDDAPLCLIVLDGTWHQARRIRMRFLQAKIPFARLPPDDDVSHYALRQGHFEGSRSTLEAAARALAIVERDESLYTHLVDPFRKMVDRTLWLRGAKDADDVYGGLPPDVSRHDINQRWVPTPTKGG